MKRGVIFVYHRVMPLARDPHRIAVHPERFDEQIKFLSERYDVLSLPELTKRITMGNSLKHCAAITFDDGYADNLHAAKPILEKYQVHATVFVTAGMIGSRREFWWDELERLFHEDGVASLPRTIRIGNHEFSLDGNGQDMPMGSHSEVHHFLKYLSRREREKALDDFFAWRKLDRDEGRETHRVLHREELRELARGGLIEIGSHSLTHPVLLSESGEARWCEISESRRKLEEMLDSEIRSFSYPYGQRRDMDEGIVQMVKRAGYACAVANIQGNIDGKADIHVLPRRIVRDWSMEEFQRNLENFSADSPPVARFQQPDGCRREPGVLHARIDGYLSNLKPCQRKLPRTDGKRQIRSVLFINKGDQKGGAAKVCFRIFKHLQRNGIHSHLLVGKKISSDPGVTAIQRVDTECQRFLNAFQEREGYLDVFHYSSFALKDAPEFKAADVVHLHNAQKNYFSLLALPELACLKPVTWTLHDMFAFTGHCANSYGCSRWELGCGECPHLNAGPKVTRDHTDLLWRLKSIIYQYSDLAIVCPSKWLQQKLAKSILKDKSTTLIYNGVDEAVFKNHNKLEARSRLNLPHEKRILFYVDCGGLKLNAQKDNLLEYMLQRMAGKDILIVSVGSSGIGGDGMNLKTLPYVEDEKEMAFYYSAADLFLYPSLADNCPLVVLESLSCGTPVISFNTGGIPELVTHKENGYIAEYNNIADLEFGVNYFLGNSSLLKRASKRARKAVLEEFTQKQMVRKYQNLYESRYREFLAHPYRMDGSYNKRITKLLGDHVPDFLL
jgi:glycosyltransferase involved in cell wall biosynthesis/peptidoglycan/xylan/chitin deacetylase (PgdA/CDA1 family)